MSGNLAKVSDLSLKGRRAIRSRLIREEGGGARDFSCLVCTTAALVFWINSSQNNPFSIYTYWLFESPTIAELAESLGQIQRSGRGYSESTFKSGVRDQKARLDNINNLSAEQIDVLLTEVLAKVDKNQ